MAKSYVQDGRVITITAASIHSGDMLKSGSIFGVALIDTDADGRVDVQVEGVFDLPLAAVNVAGGDPAYYDAGAGKVTNVSTGNAWIGSFIQAATSGDATGRVRLNESSIDPETAEKDAAITATNGGSGNAGKLFKADSNGKIAGRVLETDGTKLDGFKAIQQLTVASGQTSASLALPAGWANGDHVIASIETKGANAAFVTECKCAGGNVIVAVNTDPGTGGALINVLRTGL